MNAKVPIAVLACTLGLTGNCLKAKTKHELSAQPVLEIGLYNPARVPHAVLNCAISEAERILRAAEIKTVWRVLENEPLTDPGIDMRIPLPQTPTLQRYPVIRIVRRTLPTWAPGALGFALPFAPSGAHISIFYDRIELLAPSVNVPADVILGHAMAHEIGHFLLRSDRHSSSASGLMRASWNSAQWKLATAGLLSFLPGEAAAMRQSLAAFAPRRRPDTLLAFKAGVPAK